MVLAIAGERSGVGKTTVTLSLLASLKKKGLKIQSFKVGPDYIDPMFHQYVTGLPCRNLDPILTSTTYVQECFARHTQGVEYALVEGVMGLFDGVSQRLNKQDRDSSIYPSEASTAHIAWLLNLPVVLVIDCSRLSGSVAAIAHGYRSFDPRINLVGVVLNRVGSDRHLELLKDALEPLNLPILGVLRRQDNITIPDRHLGLIPTAEIPELDILIDRLAELGDACFDWEKLFPLLKCEPKFRQLPIIPSSTNHLSFKIETKTQECRIAEHFDNIQLTGNNITQSKIQNPKSKIAVAWDRAFNFYYQDNLDLLENLGAELVFWSPLKDLHLPAEVQGLYFGGGFPEVFAAELSANNSARESVKKAILSGIPTYAECGGLMYLCQQIVDFAERSHSMVGVLPTTAVMGSRLTLGYREAIALQDSPLVTTGTTFTGHEFHRSHLTQMPQNPLLQIRGYSPQSSITTEGWQIHQVHASYIHLHWGANHQPAERLIATAKSVNSKQ